MAIVTYPLNGIDFSAEDAETYLCTRTSGVFSSDSDFKASVTGDRQVTISPGLAWIKNSNFAGKSVCNTEPVPVEIPLADGTRPRIDRIVLRFDKARNESSIVLKQGTPSSAPSAKEVERTELIYELGLCTVYIKAASTIISNGDVTSTLLDESVCGLMRDGVTGIPTAQLQQQVYDLIDELRDVISGVESGSQTMLKAVYDPQGIAQDVFAFVVANSTYKYAATLKFDSWEGNGPYSQTVAIEPIDGGPSVKPNFGFYSPPMCGQVTDTETRQKLLETLALINNSDCTLGEGQITVSDVQDKPTTDIEVIWTLKEGSV